MKYLIILFFTTLTFAQSGADLTILMGGGLQPATKTFEANVIANGSTVSSSTLNAVDNFVKDTKSIRSKLLRVNLFCGADTGACFIPLFNNADDSGIPLGYAKDLNVNLDAADYAEATGLTGNGTDEYLNTGFNPLSVSEISQNDAGLGVYISSITTPTNQSIGMRNSTTIFSMHVKFTDNKSYIGVIGVETGTASGVVSAAGFVYATRTIATEYRVYVNIAETTVASNSVEERTGVVLVLARANNTTPETYSARNHRGYVITTGLTQAEALILQAAMEKFQDALGRGVF